jgi:hypothetical protein
MTIENNIWQTYETTLEDLPEYGKFGVDTWKKHNPNWSHRYMSGQDREDFFREEFDSEVYDTYMKLPMGVMKAGLWRFAILYKMGGVYADLDTTCNVPIENWYNSDYDLVLDVEGDTPWFATQVIAGKKGHPFLLDAINLCVERMKTFTESNHMVHHYTDVAMFTDSLFDSLGVEPYTIPIKDRHNEINNSDKAKEHKMFMFGGEDASRLLRRDVEHLYWGNGTHPGYIAWKSDPQVNNPNNTIKLANWED